MRGAAAVAGMGVEIRHGANLGGKGTTRGRMRGRVGKEREEDDDGAEYENRREGESPREEAPPTERAGGGGEEENERDP